MLNWLRNQSRVDLALGAVGCLVGCLTAGFGLDWSWALPGAVCGAGVAVEGTPRLLGLLVDLSAFGPPSLRRSWLRGWRQNWLKMGFTVLGYGLMGWLVIPSLGWSSGGTAALIAMVLGMFVGLWYCADRDSRFCLGLCFGAVGGLAMTHFTLGRSWLLLPVYGLLATVGVFIALFVIAAVSEVLEERSRKESTAQPALSS